MVGKNFNEKSNVKIEGLCSLKVGIYKVLLFPVKDCITS
jgi:hypothetical protein